jgi:RNA-binding protein
MTLVTGPLAGFQRTWLRAQAHPLKPTVLVGKDGVTPAVLERLSVELELHEIVKVKLTRPPDKKAQADELALGTHAELCGLIGHTVILYRPRKKDPTLKLPARDDSGPQ